ncbi:molybdopterin converting factor subunit 1 [Thalassotalea ganghwensis]
MIKVKFFGQLREQLDCQEIMVDLPEHRCVDGLLENLCQQSEKWARYLTANQVLVAVNHTMSSKEQQINQGDEVAFFPPVTGG